MEYHLAYTYDQGGNRLTKTDVLNERLVEYTYDIKLDPAEMDHPTRNNRLMYYDVFDGSGAGEPVLVEYVDYTYELSQTAVGNPTMIVRHVIGDPLYHATDLQYDSSGELMFVIRRTWEELEGECVNVETVDVSEYRGRGRARYVTRRRGDPTTGDPNVYWQVLPGSERWHDYDGDVIYSDYIFEIDGQTGYAEPVETTSYLPGLAQTNLDTGEISYYHSDHLGTLRASSTTQGEPVQMLVHTAFGEPICGAGGTAECIPGVPPADTRYQYAGAWQYQTADDDALSALGWLHVGHRYYDPSTGRSVQRDPIGIRAGTNAYDYVRNNPTSSVDPLGLWSWRRALLGGVGGALVAAKSGGPPQVIALAGCVGFVVSGYDPGDEVKAAKAIVKGLQKIAMGDSFRHMGCGCFVAETKVHTPTGGVDMDQLAVGAEVIAYDRRDADSAGLGRCPDAFIVGRITHVRSLFVTELIELHLPNERIRCTAQHPFWVVARGWTAAARLSAGDLLENIDGKPVPVLNKRYVRPKQPVQVFDITVDGVHTYYVGESKVLVHNKGM